MHGLRSNGKKERNQQKVKKLRIIIVLLCVLLVFGAGCKPKAEPQPAPEANMGNPWTETDHERFTKDLGLDLNVPEGAENVVFRENLTEQLGEMRFTLNGIDFNTRIKGAGSFEDISGMNYTWEHEEEGNAHWHQEKLMQAKDGDNTVRVFLWHDVVPGIMYSLSCAAPDLEGFDIIAVAQMVYKPMQGDA